MACSVSVTLPFKKSHLKLLSCGPALATRKLFQSGKFAFSVKGKSIVDSELPLIEEKNNSVTVFFLFFIFFGRRGLFKSDTWVVQFHLTILNKPSRF